jgi:hypothetical protein
MSSSTQKSHYYGGLWVFKHFFDNKKTFKSLAENYNSDKFGFEFKTFGERNQTLKILDHAGSDCELVEDLRPFVVKLSGYTRYTPLLKIQYLVWKRRI